MAALVQAMSPNTMPCARHAAHPCATSLSHPQIISVAWKSGQKVYISMRQGGRYNYDKMYLQAKQHGLEELSALLYQVPPARIGKGKGSVAQCVSVRSTSLPQRSLVVPPPACHTCRLPSSPCRHVIVA